MNSPDLVTQTSPAALHGRLRVFVSSKMEELAEERRAIKRALIPLRVDAWVFKPDAGARAESIRSTYLDELDAADLYIGVFWTGYGGYTIDEYEHARKAGKDCLIYEKRKEIGGRDARLQQFLDSLGDVESGLTVKWFNDAAELGGFIQEDVAAWQTRIVRARRRALGAAPFQAPAPRRGHVARPDLLGRVKARLLRDDPAAIELAALSGMGGSGKSVMAVAAANDAEVRARFKDGVLWSTLGTTPDATSILSGWIHELCKREASFAGPGPARARCGGFLQAGGGPTDLQTLLRDRAVLLVLNDVWDAEPVRELVVGGPACAVLITTREAGIARALGVQDEDTVEVGAMTEAEALALLASRLGPAFDARRDMAVQVAAAVGFLPLALDLVAAQVATGAAWEELLADLGAEVARLEALDDPSLDEITDALATRRLSLISSLALSVKRLPRVRLERFAWLGVYPDDTGITAAPAATLWDTDARDARDTLRYFRSRALLLPHPDAAGKAMLEKVFGSYAGNPRTLEPTYGLHDVLHALARRILTTPADAQGGVLPAGCGVPLPAAHAQLLDRHGARRHAGAWSSLPDDGYIHDHLIWHFERAGRAEEIHALLREETEAGRNAWFEAREAAGAFEAFAAEARHALARARAAGPAHPLALRYVLVLGSLNGLALAIPATLLEVLLGTGTWRVAQALGYASQTPDASRRVRSLAVVAEHVAEPRRSELLLEAFHTARTLEDDAASGWLAERLAQAGLVTEALDLARAAGAGDARTAALIAVSGKLDPAQHPALIAEAVQAAENTGEVFRSAAWRPVLPHLDETALRAALARCADMKNLTAREWVAGRMIERLAAIGAPADALKKATELRDDVTRASTLVAIAGALPEAARLEPIRAALAIVARIDDETHAGSVGDAFPELPEVLRSGLQVIVAGQSWRLDALRAIPAGSAQPIVDDVLAVLDATEDAAFAVRATAAAFHLIPESKRDRRRAEALARVAEIADPADRVSAAAGLAPILATEARARTLDIAMTALREIRFSTYREGALGALTPLLEPAHLEAAIDLVAAIEDKDDRSAAIDVLAPHLPRELLPRALNATRSIGDRDASLLTRCALAAGLDPGALAGLLEEAAAAGNDYLCARAIALLAPQLSGPLLDRAAAITRGLSFATAVSEVAVPALARRYDEPAKGALLDEAIARAAALDDPERMAWALEACRDQLSPERLDAAVDAMTAAAPRFDEDLRDFGIARILVAAAPALEGAARKQYIDRVISLMAAIENDAQLGDIVAFLAPVLDDRSREACLAVTANLSDPYRRSIGYGRIAEHTPASVRGGIVDLALAEFKEFTANEYLNEAEQMERAAVRLLPHVADLEHALELAAQFEDASQRGRALAAMVPELPAALRARALDIARAMNDAEARAEVLLALVRTAEDDERAALLGEAFSVAMAANTDLLHDTMLAPIAEIAAALPAATVRALLDGLLENLAAQPRPQVLARLHALAPMILTLGAADVADIVRAIEDVMRWWP